MPQTTTRTPRTKSAGRPYGFTARQWARCQRDEISDTEFAECLYRTVTEGPAPLTTDQARTIEAQLAADRSGWCLALAALAADGATLKDYRLQPRDVAEEAAELVAWADAMAPRLRGLAGLLDTAAWRMRVALADREDFAALLDEAAARHPVLDYGAGQEPPRAGAVAVEGIGGRKPSNTAVAVTPGRAVPRKDPRRRR